MAQPTPPTDVTPQQMMEDLWASWRTQTLITAIDLDLFTHIAAGHRTAKEIAHAASASVRGVERLLNALVGLGYLKKQGDQYRLEALSDRFLVRGRDSYMGGMADATTLVRETWSHLTEVVRSGQPVDKVDLEERGREFFPRLVAGIFPASFAAARSAIAALPAKTRGRIRRVLDVAAGSAAWSLAFAEALPEARVTVLDLPEVTPIARQFVEQFGAAERFDYLEGNLRELDFGRHRYDLVILGHIIHSEGAQWGQRLLKKSRRALKEGGLLLIGEIVPNDRRTGPALPLLFGLNMLLHTEQGDVFTLREYREWLKGAGFKKVATIDAPAPSPLILATA